jgi:hypothetical protein
MFKVFQRANPSTRLYFHCANARQSTRFYDIVLIIDVYRFNPTLASGDALHARRLA